jgi:hypothetical protein
MTHLQNINRIINRKKDAEPHRASNRFDPTVFVSGLRVREFCGSPYGGSGSNSVVRQGGRYSLFDGQFRPRSPLGFKCLLGQCRTGRGNRALMLGVVGR